jgi:hypothetical protein
MFLFKHTLAFMHNFLSLLLKICVDKIINFTVEHALYITIFMLGAGVFDE